MVNSMNSFTPGDPLACVDDVDTKVAMVFLNHYFFLIAVEGWSGFGVTEVAGDLVDVTDLV